MAEKPSFFSPLHFRVGWSVFWRVWLATIALEILVTIPLTFLFAARQTPSDDPAVVRQQFENIRALSSIIVLFAVIPAYHWAGETALRKRGVLVPKRFIGWSIFWRGLGLGLLFGVGMIAIIAPGEIWLLSESLKTFWRLFAMAVFLVLILYSYGWATLRVSRTANPD